MAKNLTNSSNIQINESGNDINLDFTIETQEIINKITPNETKLNRIAGKILWQNPNPTSSFAAQMIMLSSSDYDILEIIYLYSTSVNNCMSLKTIKGKGAFLSAYSGYDSKGAMRNIAYINDTTLNVQNSFYNSTSGSPNYCIPLYIIGYKTGLFN